MAASEDAADNFIMLTKAFGMFKVAAFKKKTNEKLLKA
jgi:hypothetical protein